MLMIKLCLACENLDVIGLPISRWRFLQKNSFLNIKHYIILHMLTLNLIQAISITLTITRILTLTLHKHKASVTLASNCE